MGITVQKVYFLIYLHCLFSVIPQSGVSSALAAPLHSYVMTCCCDYDGHTAVQHDSIMDNAS